MNRQDLLKNVKENIRPDSTILSEDNYEILLEATIKAIDATLEDGNIVDIDDFGVFSRRKKDGMSVSFFRPSERLNDRINRRR